MKEITYCDSKIYSCSKFGAQKPNKYISTIFIHCNSARIDNPNKIIEIWLFWTVPKQALKNNWYLLLNISTYCETLLEIFAQ